MAHTWGPGGLNLYLDGELAGTHEFTGGPVEFADWMAINNVEPGAANFPSNCVVDEIRIFDHQKSAGEFLLVPSSVEGPEGKMTTVWGSIKL